MNFNKIIDDMDRQNIELTEMYRDFVKQQNRAIAGLIGGAVGFTAVLIYKTYKQSK